MIAAFILAATCNAQLWKHVYHPKRLVVIESCKSFTGVIEHRKAEADGDVHMQLRLDPGQGKPLNHRNMVKQKGCLVVEPVCVGRVKQADAVEACKDTPVLAIPPTGSHVRVTGSYIIDKEANHGWIEIHPVTSFEILK
jgi:hypothetical protein